MTRPTVLLAILIIGLTACSTGGVPTAPSTVKPSQPVTSLGTSATGTPTGQVTTAPIGQGTPHPLVDPCDLLTSEEIAQVFGEDTSAADDSHTDACWWYFGNATTTGEKTLEVSLWSGTDPSASYSAWQRQFQQRQDVVQVEVAGHPAMFVPAAGLNPALIVQTDGGGALSIQTSGFMGDTNVQESFVALAQLSLPRT